MRTSSKFGGSILRGARQNFRIEHGRGGRTSIVFSQKRRGGKLGERSSTPGINSHQVDPVPGKY